MFLDPQKAYYALEQDRCLAILAGYGVGPRTLLILKNWARLRMVAKDDR